jgi:hypothetical protein
VPVTELVLVSERDIVGEGVLVKVSEDVIEREEENEGDSDGTEPIPTRSEHVPESKP